MNLIQWMNEHPARAGAITGWYQQACGFLALLILIPVITRTLGATTAGVWFSFQTILVFLGVADFGFSQVISRQIAHLVRKNARSAFMQKTDFIDLAEGWKGVGEVHAAARTLFHRAALAVLLLLLLIHECVLPLGKLGESRSFSTTLSWYFLGGATIFSLEARPYHALLEGIGKLYASNLIAGSCQLASALASSLTALATNEIAFVALAACGLSWLQYLAYRRALRVFTKLPPSCPHSTGLIKKLWRVSASLGQVNLAALMVSSIQVPLLSKSYRSL